MDHIKPIKKQNISNEIFEQLLENISTHKWEQGSKIPSEQDLSNSFGVSRVSVRAALQRLVGLGVLEIRNGEGTFVKENPEYFMLFNPFYQQMVLGTYDIEYLLEFRRGLERITIELAIKRASDAEMDNLGKIFKKMKLAAEKEDNENFTKEDWNFHQYIAEMAKNPVIHYIFEILRMPMITHVEKMNEKLGCKLNIIQHEQVYLFMKERNFEEAYKYFELCMNRSTESWLAVKEKEKSS